MPEQRRAFLISSVSLLGLVAVWLVGTVRATGSVVFPFDDPYIHLAIAENLVHQGTWGIDPGAYESASSSPAWVLLLAVGALVRIPGEAVALTLNLAAGLWVLRTTARIPLVQRLGSTTLATAVACLLPISTGVAVLVTMGLEHTLHTAIALALLALVVDRSGADGPRSTQRAGRVIPVLAFAGTLVRFETGLIVAALGVAFLVTTRPGELARRVRDVLLWVVAAASAVVATGSVNVAFGREFLPNSVVAKGTLDLVPALSPDRVRYLTEDLRFGSMLAAGAVTLLVLGQRRLDAFALPLLASLGSGVLLLAVGPLSTAWLSRYQTFVVAMLVFSMMLAAVHLAPTRAVVFAVVSAALLLPLPSHVQRLGEAIRASEEIDGHHRATTALLNRFHAGETVAINDVGYIGYRFDGRVVDLIGLASHEALAARRTGTLDQAWVTTHFAEHDVRLAIGYAGWIRDDLPAGWREAGRWCLTGPRYAAAAPCQVVYAPEDRVEAITRELVEFAPSLPDSVQLTTPPT